MNFGLFFFHNDPLWKSSIFECERKHHLCVASSFFWQVPPTVQGSPGNSRPVNSFQEQILRQGWGTFCTIFTYLQKMCLSSVFFSLKSGYNMNPRWIGFIHLHPPPKNMKNSKIFVFWSIRSIDFSMVSFMWFLSTSSRRKLRSAAAMELRSDRFRPAFFCVAKRCWDLSHGWFQYELMWWLYIQYDNIWSICLYDTIWDFDLKLWFVIDDRYCSTRMFLCDVIFVVDDSTSYVEIW